MVTIFIIILGSFIVGALGGLLGVGGGTFLVPILVFFLNLQTVDAVTISLFCMVATSIIASRSIVKHNAILIYDALFLEIFTILGATLTSLFAYKIDNNILTIMFACLLYLLAAFSWFTTSQASNNHVDISNNNFFKLLSTKQKIKIATAAFLTGSCSGLFGIGGGIILVPILMIIAGIPISFASQISILTMMATSSIALFIHINSHSIEMNIAMYALIGVLPASRFGAKIRRLLSDKVIITIFTIFSTCVATLLMVKSLG